MKGVLENSMHATHGRPLRAKPGDLILIYQTKNSLKAGEKPINYVMDYVSCEKDIDDVIYCLNSIFIWGLYIE